MAGGRHWPSRDRLSELPDNVLEHILLCLPLKEAAKTSVLSTEWKERWTFLPHLVFAFPLLNKNNLVDAYHILLRQRGAITKFHLNMRSVLEGSVLEDRVSRVACTDWVELVSKRCLEDFKLGLYCTPPLKVPRSFFSCQNLRHLELKGFEFSPPPGFHGFPRLVRLNLIDIEIASDVLGSLLYNCTLLESLTLHLEIIDFEVNMPNLKYFQVSGTIGYVCLTAPLLATLDIEIFGVHNHGIHSRQGFEIHGSQIMLQKFSSGCVVGVVNSMKFPPICFRQAKFVELYYLEFMYGLEEAISLLKKAPNLEQLIVTEETAFEKHEELNEEVAVKEVRRWFDKETSQETFLSRLKGVEITTAFWCDSQEFIKCLLERAPALQRIHVKVFSVNDTIMRLGFVKDKLLSYTRASPRAEVYVSQSD